MVWDQIPDNVPCDTMFGDKEKTDRAFEKAIHVVKALYDALATTCSGPSLIGTPQSMYFTDEPTVWTSAWAVPATSHRRNVSLSSCRAA